MTNRVIIYPYKMYSASAKRLAEALEARRVRESGKYRPRATDTIINWGNSNIPKWWIGSWNNKHWGNHPEYVGYAINKKDAFAYMKAAGVSIPEVTVLSEVASQWLREGKTVMGRGTLTGTSGHGIVVMSSHLSEYCPLYTVYKKKKAEYRVHVMNGNVFDVEQKRKRRGVESNPLIRSAANGWVFCRENVNLPEDCAKQAVAAVRALGLFFGGVDVIWNEAEQKAYVLEVNTAPGLEGLTVTKYAEEFKRYL